MPDAMSEDELLTMTEDMCLGGVGHFFSTFIMQREYVKVVDAHVNNTTYVSNGGENQGEKQVIVNLDLIRLSDGLESKFKDILGENKLRRFLDKAKEGENINYLKGKVLNAFYYNGEPIQIMINKYAVQDK